MSCGNCHRDSQREIFQRRVHIYFWYYKKRFFGDWRKEQKVRKSSDKTDQNVHNLKTGGKIPAWNTDHAFFFYDYIYERNTLGLIHKGTGGSHVVCSTLLGNLIHDERELDTQSDLSPFCLRLWFDMTVDMTVGLLTILHMFPPFWLLQQLIHDNLYSHTVLGIKDEKSCGKKKGPDYFLP